MSELPFYKANRALAEAAMLLLGAEHPMTLRQLFYRLVSAGHLPSTAHKHYARLAGVMGTLRERGHVPRDWLVDNLRATLKPSTWSGLGDFADTVRGAYRRDRWADLSDYVHVFVEKDAIAGVMEPTTDEYDVRLSVCRGYASISFAGEVADDWAATDKPIHAYYLGDYDPSGFDIERDLREKLERYSGRDFNWTRLGVCRADFDDLDLLPLDVKLSDTRAAAFIEEHGRRCAEVDAIPPTVLRARLTEAIERHIDPRQWEILGAMERDEQATLRRALGALGGNLGQDTDCEGDA